MSECIFCQIVAGESPSYTVWEDEKHLAFLSIFPNTKGFTVLITKEHRPSDVMNLPENEYKDLLLAAKKVSLLLTDTFKDVGRTGLIIEGFGIDHAHIKLSPMHGTPSQENWRKMESDINTYFEKYEGYISSNGSHRANDEELAQVAEIIRKKNI